MELLPGEMASLAKSKVAEINEHCPIN